ncbi:phosphorylase family protein [Massilia litorea]|uniref:Squalene--hopene cyclase n=1 Tax=Massilia litorea TaxID=2769491 RepID=A0A7L9TZY6_9BURK|nr:squalene--hopene cyclase [Massilia litorea]QOL48187.1 squalene--hopene cyclase [Massilia litorea]
MKPDPAHSGAPVLVVCGLAFETAIAAGPGVIAVCGPGPARVAAAIDALAGGTDAGWAGILSFGCAGALDPALRAGDCVMASSVTSAAGTFAVDPAWTRSLQERLPRAHCGALAGLDAPLISRAAKAQLWQASGALAVDMESHAAALAARRLGLPFAAMRIVLDPASRSLPPCALTAMRKDGTTDPAALLRALALAPGQLAPLLLLAADAWRARRTLRAVRARFGTALAPPGGSRSGAPDKIC